MANSVHSYKVYVDGEYTETVVVPSDYDIHNLTNCILSCASIQVKLGPKRKMNSMRISGDAKKVDLYTYRKKSLQLSNLV